MQNELIAIDKNQSMEKGQRIGSGYRSEPEKKKGTCDRGQTQTGRSPSSPIHDHLDQFCKRGEKKKRSEFHGRPFDQRPPPTAARGAKACPPHPGREVLHLEADP